jgi:hypothetical protein
MQMMFIREAYMIDKLVVEGEAYQSCNRYARLKRCEGGALVTCA